MGSSLCDNVQVPPPGKFYIQCLEFYTGIIMYAQVIESLMAFVSELNIKPLLSLNLDTRY